MAQLKDLLVNGVARFMGRVYAKEFVGKLDWENVQNKPFTELTTEDDGKLLGVVDGKIALVSITNGNEVSY